MPKPITIAYSTDAASQKEWQQAACYISDLKQKILISKTAGLFALFYGGSAVVIGPSSASLAGASFAVAIPLATICLGTHWFAHENIDKVKARFVGKQKHSLDIFEKATEIKYGLQKVEKNTHKAFRNVGVAITAASATVFVAASSFAARNSDWLMSNPVGELPSSTISSVVAFGLGVCAFSIFDAVKAKKLADKWEGGVKIDFLNHPKPCSCNKVSKLDS